MNELFDCADACVYDTSCASINVDKNNTPWICELVVDDRNTKDEYVDAEGSQEVFHNSLSYLISAIVKENVRF